MIFFSRSKPIHLDFFTTNPAIFEHAKPERAAKFIPQWWKNIPKDGYDHKDDLEPRRTIKRCHAFMELYNKGFIHPLWSEVNIQIDPDGAYVYQYADHNSEIISHQSFQYVGSPFHKQYVQLRFQSPWMAKTKSSASWLWTCAQWNGIGIKQMIVSHGVFAFNIVPTPLHINTFFEIPKERVTHRLNFGIPLAHVIPLSEKKLKMKHHLINTEEFEKMKKRTTMHFFFSNSLSKARKMCPYG